MMRAKNHRLLSEAFEVAARFALNSLDDDLELERLDDTRREAFLAKLDDEFWLAVDERFIVEDENEPDKA